MKEPVTVSLAKQDALLIVDVQNDFVNGGALAVDGAGEIIPVLNSYIEIFKKHSLPIFLSRDWHPPDHCSFQEYGGEWPPHCVAGTHGADFATDLLLPANVQVISKATSADREEYSDFDSPDMQKALESYGVKRLFVGGLATEFCVFYTVRDALKYGYHTFVLADGVRAINLSADDGARAMAEMVSLGAEQVVLAGIVS